MRGAERAASEAPRGPGATSEVREAKRQGGVNERRKNPGHTRKKGRGTENSTHGAKSLTPARRHDSAEDLPRESEREPRPARVLTGGPACDVISRRVLGSTSDSPPPSIAAQADDVLSAPGFEELRDLENSFHVRMTKIY